MKELTVEMSPAEGGGNQFPEKLGRFFQDNAPDAHRPRAQAVHKGIQCRGR